MSTQSNPRFLSWRDNAILLVAALVVDMLIASLQPVPGYMDAAYYYATGIQLAEGHGFTEPFIWNYLDAPQTLPHPSHSYWYPLASLISAAGMGLTGRMDFSSARIGFLVVAILFPLATATLAWRVTKKRGLALVSGFLAVFCGYYLPFIVTTDHYAIYMLIGAIYFILLFDGVSFIKAFLLGLLAGVLNLSRADGLLWLPLTLAAVILLSYQGKKSESFGARLMSSSLAGLAAFGGYLLVMGGWFYRNMEVFGSLTPPGSGYVLWMTNYNQIFSFTPESYTFGTWISTGWKEILSARVTALGQNLGTALMAQGSVFLSPFIVIGAWKNRKLPIVKFALTGWVMLMLVESAVFPFASIRGGFFHAGAVFQPLWFVLAPLSVDSLLEAWVKNKERVKWFCHILLVVSVIALSVMLVKIRVVDSGWNEGEYNYLRADEIITESGADADAVIMTSNPPAYNAMTGRMAVMIPTGEVESLLSAADRFGARYLVLEENRLPGPILDIYLHPENYPEFLDIGGFDDVRVFLIESEE